MYLFKIIKSDHQNEWSNSHYSGSQILYFTVVCVCLDYMALNGRMTGEQWIAKDLEGSGHGQMKILWHLLEVTEESHEKLQPV
jgi:hypothetical protein